MEEIIYEKLPIAESNINSFPINNWISSTFFEKHFFGRKPQRFCFLKLSKPLSPIEISFSNINYRWVDGIWYNLGTEYNKFTFNLTEEEEQKIIKENSNLFIEIKILEELNTTLLLEKLKLEKKLLKLENKIKSFPGII